MEKILLNIEVFLAIFLIIAVLLQHQGSGLGGTFGGEGNFYRSRRGIEKALFIFTIVIACLFAIIALTVLAIK